MSAYDLKNKASDALNKENLRLFNKYHEFMELIWEYWESINALKDLKEHTSYSSFTKDDFDIHLGEYNLTVHGRVGRDVIINKTTNVLTRYRKFIPKPIFEKQQQIIFFVDLHRWRDRKIDKNIRNTEEEYNSYCSEIFRICNNFDENELDQVIISFVNVLSSKLMELQFEFEEILKTKNKDHIVLSKIEISNEIKDQLAAIKEVRELN